MLLTLRKVTQELDKGMRFPAPSRNQLRATAAFDESLRAVSVAMAKSIMKSSNTSERVVFPDNPLKIVVAESCSGHS